MEINNLLNQIKKTPTNTKKFIAIEIGTEAVKTATWEVVDTKPHLIATGTIEEFNIKQPDKFITAVDTSLSKALQEVEPEPDKVIFSLPESWVEGEQIAADKKPLLQQLTRKLDLKPIGFVVTLEALIHYLKLKNGGPFSGILVGVTEPEVTVTLVLNGKITESHTVGRSDDLGADVQEGIARFQSLDSLPPNMVLYNGHTHLESEKQELISYDWQEKLPFLHIPKIEALAPDETIKAVVQAGGLEVIKSLQVSKDSSASPQTQTKSSNSSSSTSPPASSPGEPISDTESLPDLSDDFGFTSDFASADNFTPATLPKPSSQDSQPSLLEPKKTPSSSPDTFSSTPTRKIAKPKLHLPRLSHSSLKLSLPQLGRNKLLLLAVIALFFTLAASVSVLAAYWYLPTAQVTLVFEPKTIDTDLEFTIDPNLDQPDLDTNTIPGRIIEAQAQTQLQTAATGSKLVGEKASGTVTLYNLSNTAISLEASTLLTGPDSLTYTLDQPVQIASASTKPGANKYEQITTPSTVQATITATQIGAKFNLGSGTQFAVEGFSKSQLVAESDTEISGGSSRQITAVASEDLESLSRQAREQLEQDIQNQFINQEDIIGAILLNRDNYDYQENFSQEEGDEAQSVTLEANMTAQVMTYNRDHTNLLLEKQTLAQIPDKYQFLPQNSTLEITQITIQPDQTVKVTAKAKAHLAPFIDSDQIAHNIRGRNLQVTKSYFESLPGFSKAIIDIRPKWLPSPLKTFPRLTQNIHITTITQ